MALSIKMGELYRIYVNMLRLQCNSLAIATQLVSARPLDLTGTIRGRHLVNVTYELWESLKHQLLGNVVPRVSMVHRVFPIITVGSGT